jgi:hypothetical protein
MSITLYHYTTEHGEARILEKGFGQQDCFCGLDRNYKNLVGVPFHSWAGGPPIWLSDMNVVDHHCKVEIVAIEEVIEPYLAQNRTEEVGDEFCIPIEMANALLRASHSPEVKEGT